MISLLLAALTVVETDGRLSVMRDDRPLVTSVWMDRGGIDEKDVKSSYVVTKAGDKVWNRWSEEKDRRFRMEVAQRHDGVIELTMLSDVDPFSEFKKRYLRLDIPAEAFGASDYRYYIQEHRAIELHNGKLDENFGKISARVFEAGGIVIDFNAYGAGDECSFASDGWKYMGAIFGFGTMQRREDGGYEVSVGGNVNISWGEMAGAKILIREGDIERYDDWHSVRRFHYGQDSNPVHLLGFGSSLRGNVYAEGNYLYDCKRGYGWLDWHQWDRESIEGSGERGVLYSGCSGPLDETYRFGNLADGWYLVTFVAGNWPGVKNRFSVMLNGARFLDEVSIAKGTARRVTKVVYVKGGKLDVGIKVKEGDAWLVSSLGLQALLMDGEDFAMNRGTWLVDGYEPSCMNRNVDFPPIGELPLHDETLELPTPGTECTGEAKEYPLPISLPDPNAPGLAWTKNANIFRILNNTCTINNFQTDEELKRYFAQEVDGKGVTAIMLSGMLSRHTYCGQIDRGLKDVGRITAEAHRRGYKVIDHFDATLYWNIGGGFRTLAERLDEMDRSIVTGLPAYQSCIMNPKFRKAFFEYCRRDVVENKIDGLQLDEVQMWGHGCQCIHCRRAFEKDTGWKMPADETSDLWKPGSAFYREWKTWRIRKATDLIGELREYLKPVKDDLVFSCYTTPYGLSSTYDTLWNGRDIFDMPRALNFFGIEVMSRSVMKSFRSELATHRIMNLIPILNGAPVWNWYYNANWQTDYAAWALDQMTAQTPMLAEVEHPKGSPDYANFRAGMRRDGAETVAEIALLNSADNRTWNRPIRVDRSVPGTAQALDALHVPFDVIGDETLAFGKLSKYKMLVYPPKSEFTKAQHRALEDFVAQGGRIVESSGEQYWWPSLVVGHSVSDNRSYCGSPEGEAAYLREVSEWSAAANPWKVRAPSKVFTSLYREKDGAYAVHFFNATGVKVTVDEIVTDAAPDPAFPMLDEDVVFTLPRGVKAVATSPDFEGERELTVRATSEGVEITLPRELLTAYTFVRVY